MGDKNHGTIRSTAMRMRVVFIALLLAAMSTTTSVCQAFGANGSFLGTSLRWERSINFSLTTTRRSYLTMRKQKASDRRTRRRQRGILAVDDEEAEEGTLVVPRTTATTTRAKRRTNKNPMQNAEWKHKSTRRIASSRSRRSSQRDATTTTGGRGRSRKRANLYQTLQHYQNHFLSQLTAEYQAEEEEVLGRIQASLDDPLGLEQAGYALFDMHVERRGNLFTDEVYRFTKAKDATTSYPRDGMEEGQTASATADATIRYLPPNHKFGMNDVIVLTEQPNGSGDFFTKHSLPTADTATTAEARVLNMGPTYLDVALEAGVFEASFGLASNDTSGKGNRKLRLRVDRYVSNVSYQRMVAALSQLTAVPENKKALPAANISNKAKTGRNKEEEKNIAPEINMDAVLKEAILSTHAFTDPSSPQRGDPGVCDLTALSYKLAQPPMATSPKLAKQVIKHLRSDPNFAEFNAPQLAAIEAALSRRMTMIQGPPGSGKTTVGAAIGFGFAHQCRSVSTHTKVLACAFSNVGADNLAEALIKLGLNVVRVGKPSAVLECLWEYTLDAKIGRDPKSQKALQAAAKATASLARRRRGAGQSMSERHLRDSATSAVKASIKASNIAATKALREADVIVSTSTGAADARLLAACGIVADTEEGSENAWSKQSDRAMAPDGLPPLSLPFVLVDEACQSVEPATLIPILSSNSCRSLVMLGDPCQLPPTVKSRDAADLSMSLMERLAATLPHPSVIPSIETTGKDTSYLDTLPIKQAVSLVRARTPGGDHRSYRKVYSGSLLLPYQYRMHPSIAAFPSAIFYDGLLATPDCMRDTRSFPRSLNRIMPCGNPDLCVRLIDIGGPDNERQGKQSRYTRTLYSHSAASKTSLEQQTTFWNEAEAEKVLAILKDTLAIGHHQEVSSIGIISPYNGQVQLIKSLIANDAELRELLRKLPVSIEVKSVDGYQGRERDVIIFSAVRSNRQQRIGFLHDWRRMNVALTRAKSALLIIGDLDTLSSANKHWDALKKWATGMRCIVDDYDCPEDEVSV